MEITYFECVVALFLIIEIGMYFSDGLKPSNHLMEIVILIFNPAGLDNSIYFQHFS